jgi:hypothetical protein
VLTLGGADLLVPGDVSSDRTGVDLDCMEIAVYLDVVFGLDRPETARDFHRMLCKGSRNAIGFSR